MDPGTNHTRRRSDIDQVQRRPFLSWGIAHTHTVAGVLVPDSTGTYETAGWLNGKGYARRADGAYFIWWDGVDRWNISEVLDVIGTLGWERIDAEINGAYSPYGTATGTATVS